MGRRTWGLVAVVALALGSGWLGAWLDRSLAFAGRAAGPGMLVWLTGPLVAVVAIRLLGATGAHGRWRPRLAAAWPWYLLALGTYPVLAILSTWVGGELVGLGPAVLPVVAAALPAAVVKDVVEETVWRGYLAGELLSRGWRDTAVYVGSGLVWGLWHLPYYLVMLPERDMRQLLDVPRWGFALVAVAVMVAWSVLFVELYRVSGTIWTVVLLHAAQDAVVTPLVHGGHLVARPGTAWLFTPVVGTLPALVCLGLGLMLRERRLRGPVRRRSTARGRRWAVR